jgi:hypothetical protein
MRTLTVLLLLGGFSGCRGGEVHDLSTQQLSSVVVAQQPSLKRCYDAALEKTPYKQPMELQAIIHIEPSGEVDSVQIEGSGGLPGMSSCLRDAIKKWRFPEAEDATHTSLPLQFKPEIKHAGPTIDQMQEALRGLYNADKPK